ncbi:RdRP-domain-containing protein [Gymnopilus junonius]|uniref:RNA-dependent RNA polymerase n=1 Tax=Gymnopilus junonius TaxID=109634 RepID=A0A9P5TST4_GYMJU|nr:RdRP-domain-containing protein [Gymnopilus junonius]
MNISIVRIPEDANEWTITRKLASVLHSEDFAPVVAGRVLNFSVKLEYSDPENCIRHTGKGVLTLPTEAIGNKFLDYVHGPGKIKMGKRKLDFRRSNRPPPKGQTLTLKKTPYVNPDIEEERLLKVRQLDDSILRIDSIQFGIFYQTNHTMQGGGRPSPRAFSVEWERNYVENDFGSLKFEYDHKLIRITLGNELREAEGCSIAINFASIRKIGLGYDGKPYICFDTLTPPVMERIQFHRALTGKRDIDYRKYKQRIGAIHEGHAIVAPYTPHLRVLLYNTQDRESLRVFCEACKVAGLSDSMIIKLTHPGALQIEALKNRFFAPKRMYLLHKELGRFDWPIAFQLESLLHNGLLHTGDMDDLIPRISDLKGKHKHRGPIFVGEVLRRYNEALQVRPAQESPARCFERVLEKFVFSDPRDAFRCYHVTFTPSRMLLEGPYPSQSNRIIREYEGFEDYFIRVDFRDEDRLQYRWDREVDGTSFLKERVGKTLKQGFELAGRKFEFLAYSSSALRQHAVWFMNPFDDPKKGHVDADSIRNKIGDFGGTELLRQPSKYAARLAQAFTATDQSVDIERSEWEEVPDLGEKPYLFTDGAGTISKALGDKIWNKLCIKKHDPDILKPSAYQIRFLGYKGVVAIDEQLDKSAKGIHMRLRPSMRKFEVANDNIAKIEIAQAFERPNTCYLNRPLIMLLEDLGVRVEALQELQDKAVEDAKLIDQSIDKFCDVISAHHLGVSYKLRHILTRLRDKYNMDLTSNGKTVAMDTPFWRQLRQVAMTDILRDIKHHARIPVPDSYLLVGVADEGPAYEAAGYENIYSLAEGQIYACIQKQDEKAPIWIEGTVSISRSPVAYPGDVQRVRAIGKPPEGMLCLFSHLKNVVVMSSRGKPLSPIFFHCLPDYRLGSRSLASCLGGGDVDGDLFAVICHDPVLPRTVEAPASYDALKTFQLDRDSTVDDICDFIVEYINSDLLGLLSDRLLVVADQSSEGMRDEICLKLAELCSHAVDYPKQGTPLNFDPEQLPRTLIRCKPDWHAAEVVSPRKTDYYESSRALGHLFRSIELDETPPILAEGAPCKPLSDPISVALLDQVHEYLGDSAYADDQPPPELLKVFGHYVDELRYICATHTLSNTPGVRLLEAEIVVGTILAKCSQKRYRSDRIYRMREHAKILVRDVQRSLLENVEDASYSAYVRGLELAWAAWNLSLSKGDEFGAHSFSLIALGIIFDSLDGLSK